MTRCTCVAVTDFHPEDRGQLNKLQDLAKTNFNKRGEEIRKHWGGGERGKKSQARFDKMEKTRARELTQQMG